MRIGNWSVPNSEQQTAKVNTSEAEVAESSGETEESGEVTLQQRPAKAERAVNIDEIIKAFQLPDTPATRGLIAEMARGGIELSAENIDILSKALEAFPEQKPEQIVFMAREGITINKPNVERFQQFLEHKNLVGEQLSNILRQLPAEFSEKPIDDTGDALRVSNPETPEEPISDIDGSPRTTNIETPEKQPAEVGDEHLASSSETPEKQPTEVGDAHRASSPETPEKQPAEVGDAHRASRPENAEKQPAEAGDAHQVYHSENAEKQPAEARDAHRTFHPENAEKQPTEVGDAHRASRPEPPEQPTEVGDAHRASRPEPPEQPAEAGDAHRASRPETPEKQSAEAGDAHRASSPEAPEKQTAEAVNAHRASRPVPNEEPATIEQKIMSLFKKVDSKNPHKLPRELNARELVRELAEVIETVKEKLPELEPSRRETLGKAVAELEQSVKFMDNLNKYTPIVNIPLQWGDERTTAELYVFNDSKRGRKIDPQNATMFVSLMTANAGRVETMIKVLGKNVECDFSVELTEVADTIRGEMHTLYNLLDAQGFKLARTTAQAAEKTSDIFDVSKVREQNKSRYFFDRKV